jgi:S1-C subfamily serine protease
MQALDLDNGGAASRRVVAIERNGAQLVSVLDAKPARDADKKLRELPKAWLGIETQPITVTTAALIDGPSGGGYRITRVYEDSPADKAGIQVGDVLTSLSGSAVPVSGDIGDEPLQSRIRESLLDEPLQIEVWWQDARVGGRADGCAGACVVAEVAHHRLARPRRTQYRFL